MPARSLRIALYREGKSDTYFLRRLVYRVADGFVQQRARSAIDVQDVEDMQNWAGKPDPTGTYEQRVVEAARRAYGSDILCIHHDADSPDTANVEERICFPAREAIHNASDNLCRVLVFITPIRSIEAWMLADKAAFLSAFDSNVRPAKLKLPQKPHQVESEQEPKQVLERAIQVALGNKRQRRVGPNITDTFSLLADDIDLALLQQVPSFATFRKELEDTLIALRFITE